MLGSGSDYVLVGETVETNLQDRDVERGRTYAYPVTWMLDGSRASPPTTSRSSSRTSSELYGSITTSITRSAGCGSAPTRTASTSLLVSPSSNTIRYSPVASVSS